MGSRYDGASDMAPDSLSRYRQSSAAGVHAIGTGPTELIHIGQAVLGLGTGLDDVFNRVFNYPTPTLAECYKAAILNVSNKLLRNSLASERPPESLPSQQQQEVRRCNVSSFG